MVRKIICLIIILSVGLSFSSCNIFSKVKYLEYDDYAELIKHTGGGDVTVDSHYKGKPVKKIGYAAFMNNRDVISVTLPDTVTDIEEYAFLGCSNLKEVKFGKQLEIIGKSAFQFTKIDKLVLTENVKELKDGALTIYNRLSEDIAGLYEKRSISIEVDDKNDNFIVENNNLFNKDKTILYFYSPLNPESQYTIPETVKEIGFDAFSYCNSLSSVIMPDTLEKIGEQAFEMCDNLDNVEIPESVSEFGCDSFLDTKWLKKQGTYVTYKNTILIGYNYDDNKGIVNIPEGITRVYCTFSSGAELTTINIPASVEYFSPTALGYLRSIFYRVSEDNQHFVVENSMLLSKDKTILYKYNKHDTYDYSVTLPEQVTTITEYAFPIDVSLFEITIPSGVTEIENHVFDYCDYLNKVVIHENVTKIGRSNFLYDNYTKNVVFYGKKNSFAQKFAKENGIKFVVE